MTFSVFRALSATAAIAATIIGGPRPAEARLLNGASASQEMTFEDFVRLHGRSFAPDSEEFHQRRSLFAVNLKRVLALNSRPDNLWMATVNKFADRTPEELAALRGYSRDARSEAAGGGAAGSGGQVQLLGKASHVVDLDALPQDFTWRSKLKATTEVLNQKACGSCWAHSSSTVLRAHSELYQKEHFCSVEQILSCTPNPRHCGGDGGCKGATAELGIGYVVSKGCVSNSDWSYTSKAEQKQCPEVEANFAESARYADAGSIRLHAPSALISQDGAVNTALGLSMGLKGYTKLAENRLAPVMVALVERGPVAISISAKPAWSLYHSGIMEGCSRDTIINHAVTLVGFGVGSQGAEQGQNYWQIQNSWGADWGEGGFMRLTRQQSDEDEAAYCGVDRKPHDGSGCAGGPPEVRVCGTCGVLYDTVVPDFAPSAHGLWANRSFLVEHELVRPRPSQGGVSQDDAGSLLARGAASRRHVA